MQLCKFSGECAFYNDRLAEMPVEAGFLKQLYCKKLPHKCQRFKHSADAAVSDPSNELPPLILYARK